MSEDIMGELYRRKALRCRAIEFDGTAEHASQIAAQIEAGVSATAPGVAWLQKGGAELKIIQGWRIVTYEHDGSHAVINGDSFDETFEPVADDDATALRKQLESMKAQIEAGDSVIVDIAGTFEAMTPEIARHLSGFILDPLTNSLRGQNDLLRGQAAARTKEVKDLEERNKRLESQLAAATLALKSVTKQRDDALATITNYNHKIPLASADAEISMVYRNYEGKIGDRTIIPRALWFGETEWHKGAQWLLRAFDVDKGAERDFALSDANFSAGKAGGLSGIFRTIRKKGPPGPPFPTTPLQIGIDFAKQPDKGLQHMIYQLAAPNEPWAAGIFRAIQEVFEERLRQIHSEAFTPDRDDKTSPNGELAAAAAAYLLSAVPHHSPVSPMCIFPFSKSWWKPSEARRDVVRALALGLAHLEQIERRRML
jgi:hypothetical protein